MEINILLKSDKRMTIEAMSSSYVSNTILYNVFDTSLTFFNLA